MFIDEVQVLIVLFRLESSSISVRTFELLEFCHEKRFANIAAIVPVDELSTSVSFEIVLVDQLLIILSLTRDTDITAATRAASTDVPVGVSRCLLSCRCKRLENRIRPA